MPTPDSLNDKISTSLPVDSHFDLPTNDSPNIRTTISSSQPQMGILRNDTINMGFSTHSSLTPIRDISVNDSQNINTTLEFPLQPNTPSKDTNPTSKNEKPLISAEITKLGEDLTGKTIVNGKVFSFRYTKPGDIVEFRFFGRGKRRWEKVENIIFKDSQNDYSKCKYFRSCGGCSSQHIPYEEQFKTQTDRLAQSYKEIWDIELDRIPAFEIYNYRNRMDFSIFPNAYGLREAANFRKVVDLEECAIQSEWANLEWARIRSYLSNNPGLPQDRRSMNGFLKYVTLRRGFYTDDSLTIFTFSLEGRDLELESNFESWLLQESNSNNIVFCYNPRKSEVSASGEYRTIRGNSFYKEIINGQEFRVPFDSFFQPNPRQFQPILECLGTWWKDSNKKVFLDLFSGSGFFSLLLGDYAETILGFDSFLPSIDMANLLVSEAFPKKKVHFQQVDLFQRKHLDKFCDSLSSLYVSLEDAFLVMDPPRNGIGGMVIDWILESGIEKIAYISCNPSKQWEEIMSGLGKNYIPVKALITDPYPHTPHLESLVLLEKKKNLGIHGIF